jgi:hypothetical protein
VLLVDDLNSSNGVCQLELYLSYFTECANAQKLLDFVEVIEVSLILSNEVTLADREPSQCVNYFILIVALQYLIMNRPDLSIERRVLHQPAVNVAILHLILIFILL